jgi:UDP-glucuronate 4-epimerase
LKTLIEQIEKAIGMKAVIERRPAQPGDVERTYADLKRSTSELGYKPRTPLAEGLRRFAVWFWENAQRYGVERAAARA